MLSGSQRFGIGAGLGGIGAGLGAWAMGGNTNPADAGMPYLNQIQGAISPYYTPYFQAGANALPGLQNQYNNLLSNPGGMVNNIGKSYQQSPGFQFAMQQALQGANHAAAAGGMAGSPQHEQQNMGIATGLANQDYYNWLQQATGMYNQGLSGQQGLAGMGANAGNNMAQQIAQQLAAQSSLAYSGQANQNQMTGSMMGDLFGGAGMLAAFM